MNWINKYKPLYLNEFLTNRLEVEKAEEWIKNYKKKTDGVKKVLFIIGGTGTGKTLLAELILKEYNYQKIELNSSDIRSQKKLGEFLKKSLTFKNVVDMFNEGTLPIGILMDEIDTICKLSDKGGMTEFLDILKQNEKNEVNKKKNKKVKHLIEDYIKLYNPIICTSNEINDKKINELKKYSEIIKLNKPSNEDLKKIIVDIYSKNNQLYEEEIIDKIIDYSLGDIRQLIIILEDLYINSNSSVINNEIFENFTKTYRKKEEDIQLLESTKLLFTKKMDIHTSQILFDIDCLLTPLMIYHNSIDFIKNCEDNSKKKLSTYKNILESLCIHDTIQTNIFEVQDWNELYHIAAMYGSSIPNYYFNTLKNKKEVEIQFTSLLNKICQMYTNKKLLNSANYSLGKINYDTDEIIYLTEIISYYFDNYKNNILINDDDDEDDNDDIEENDIIETSNVPIQISNVPIQTNNSELILFMNKYSISVDNLENILKIEKLNKTNEKRKKKFSLKIKKDISKFLINQF
jgi:DNA polymerase III delta prime subunit